MNLSSHSEVSEFMTPIEDMVIMSKNSRPKEILEMMRKNQCKHMPLTDDYSGGLLFIADIRDIVASITHKSQVSGKASTSHIVDHDIGRDSIFVSKSGKPMNWRSLSSRINLLENAEEHLSPFADGF